MFFYDVPKMNGEKKELIEKVLTIFANYSVKARMEGILALEEDFEEVDFEEPLANSFFRECISLLVDGTDAASIAEYARYRIATCSAEGDLKLALMIIANGTLIIQTGENSRVMAQKLLAMTGDFFEEFKNIILDD